MKRVVAIAGATLLGVFACTDDPTSPAMATAAVTPSMTPAAVVAHRRTTVCLSYMRKRSRAEVRLENSPTDTTLQKEVALYNRILVDACR